MKAQVQTVKPVTGEDILAILNRNTTSTPVNGDAVVDVLADSVQALSVGASRIAGAFTVGLRNTGKHYALETAVQTKRSDARLLAAANRAAERMNAS